MDIRDQIKPNIALAKPAILEEDIQRAQEVLRSGMIIQGENVAELETMCSSSIGYPVRAVSSGTAALHLALMALEIGDGDEVIVPAFSFVASANSIEVVGAKSVFVDIDLATFCIDPTQLEAKITSATKAIMPVHEFGLCANMPVIEKIAKKHGLKIIEDAACAYDAAIDGNVSGAWGDLACWSLHPRKIITSGEGGLVSSKTKELDARIEALRNHGIVYEDGQMDFIYAGLNYRLTDFQAALVTGQTKRLDKTLATHESIATRYNDGIKNSKITLPHVPDGYRHSWQTYHVVLDSSLERDEVIQQL